MGQDPPSRNHMMAGICENQRDAIEHLKECRRRGGDDRAYAIWHMKHEVVIVPTGEVKE